MTRPSASVLRGGDGYFRITVTHPKGTSLDVTTFRGVPTEISSMSTADPFGDASASLAFPAVTIFDRPGAGDLWWWVPWAGIEIRWMSGDHGGDVHAMTSSPSFVWEGDIVSEEIGDGNSISCKGALYMADNFQAAPFFPQYPVPYEKLISMSLDPRTHPSLKTRALKVTFPDNWKVKVPKPSEPSYLWFLRPWGVTTGALWSGLTSRTTGSWEPVLTGFVQTLLTTMFTPEGDQWTVMKNYGRQPELRVRATIRDVTDDTLVIQAGTPGVELSFTRDFSQSANVIFGTGQDLANTSFSGAQVAADGSTTFYQPFAALPQVYPSLTKGMIRHDARITFAPGIDEDAARDVAATKIRQFADPGYVGTITLNADPTQGGDPYNRMLITAGMSIVVQGFRGSDMLFHITQSEISPSNGTTTLNVDTRYRDALSAAEVRARTRDALDPVHMLQVGKDSAATNDMLKPWSNAGGSGIIPSGPGGNALPLFKKMSVATFPWTSYTQAYPPKKYPNYYIKVSRKGAKAQDRWQDYKWDTTHKRSYGVPIQGAAHGDIMLTQVMAVDINGNPIKIKFHLGIYASNGVNVFSMPSVPAGLKGVPYAAADYYPMFPEAFEDTKPSGEQQTAAGYLPAEGIEMQIAWGNYYEPAGYSPGLKSAGGAVSGMLIDDTAWTFDTTKDPNLDPRSTSKNVKNTTVGQLYVMIFQDDVQEAYFIGRLFHKPAGQ